MVLRTTQKFHYRNGQPRKFWGCSRWPDCNACHGAHPDGKPVGRPGTPEEKKARQAAHAAFDPIWQKGMMKRKQAYKWLARELGFEKDCHIGSFDVLMCKKVVEVCERWFAESAKVKTDPTI